MARSSKALIGIDIGTSSVKSTVIDAETGRALGSAAQEYAVSQPQPGYAEQNPDDWWQAAAATVRSALEQGKIEPSSVAGIGLSGQMHGTVCLDAALRPLRPAIIWADTRSKAQVKRLMERLDTEDMARHAPGRPAAGFMAPTLMWLAEHEPETLCRTRTVLLPKDYARLRLTGNTATDISDAAATWLMNPQTGHWSDWLLDACGLEDRYLPPVLNSIDQAGTLIPQAAQALGLLEGVPVIAGCADQPAQALAYGLYSPGTALVTIGTGGQTFAPLSAPRMDPSLRYYVFNHAVPGVWYAAAAMLSAGLSLRWLRDLLGWKGRADAYERLSALAAETPPGAEGLLFLPYLSGERTPHFDPRASGLFLGLRLHHGPGHLARAVMEGVAFAMAECLALVSSPEADMNVIASGGAAASPVWLQIQSDIYNRPLSLAPGEHHACLGAALLAGVGCGVYASFEDACLHLPAVRRSVEPTTEHVDFYSGLFERYRGLYTRLKDDMHELAG